MILISLDYRTISSWLRTSLRDYMAYSPLYLHPTTDTQTRKVWTIRYFILMITKILPISKLTLFTLLLNFLRHCCHVLAGENWECNTHKTVNFFLNAPFLPCLFSLISFLREGKLGNSCVKVFNRQDLFPFLFSIHNLQHKSVIMQYSIHNNVDSKYLPR